MVGAIRPTESKVINVNVLSTDAVLHAGGLGIFPLAHGDAGGVGASVGGCGVKDVIALFIGDGRFGDAAVKRTRHRGSCLFTVAVGCVRRLVDGHAAAVGGRAAGLAALGRDGVIHAGIGPLVGVGAEVQCILLEEYNSVLIRGVGVKCPLSSAEIT